jgi:hypothetical protein
VERLDIVVMNLMTLMSVQMNIVKHQRIPQTQKKKIPQSLGKERKKGELFVGNFFFESYNSLA